MSADDDTCSLCGRRIRQDPKTPGCYLGRCSSNVPGRRVPAKRTESEMDEHIEHVAERVERLTIHPKLRSRFQERALAAGLEPV